ncbi:hypothetical protein CLCR_01427 [Cladophialophora carrionii]|uniref:Uncharacterized protein n=1 Tax=Cladophialophora carrionii TaxID=86049 RepID=A0A1C1CBC5_9EURO|nr:hypothetical protein CLCR_01427 [Cladophialophora carrionii]
MAQDQTVSGNTGDAHLPHDGDPTHKDDTPPTAQRAVEPDSQSHPAGDGSDNQDPFPGTAQDGPQNHHQNSASDVETQEHPQVVDNATSDSEAQPPLPPVSPSPVPRKPVAKAVVVTNGAEIPDRRLAKAPAQSARDLGGFWHNWWSEMTFLILMFGAFAAIVAVIAPYQHRRLPSWPYSITINALIAVFTVILRGSILFIATKTLSQQKWIWFGGPHARPLFDLSRFDNASRGPWGSFLLVLSLHGRSLLATLGALITVLTIAIDPFAQQVVHYYSCSQASTGTNATMPRTGLFQEAGSVQLRVNANTVTPGLASAINAGVFSAEAAKRITSDCPSGNCQFSEPYHTLGYCSNCSDISDQVKVTNFDVPYTFLNQTSIIQALNTSLPSGYSTQYVTFENATYLVTGVLDPSVIESGTNAPSPFAITHEKDFQILYGAYTDDNANSGMEHPTCSEAEKHHAQTAWGCRGYGAAQCSLVPCIRTYEAAISNGTVDETLISTSRDWGYSYRVSKASVYVPCLSAQQKRALKDQGYPITDSMVWLPYDHNIDPSTGMWELNATHGTNQSATDIVPPKCLYEFFFLAMTSINEYLQSQIFNGTVTAYGSDGRAAFTSTNPVVAAIYNGGNISFPHVESLFENISLAMTSYIRQNSNGTYLGRYFQVSNTSISFDPNFLAQGTMYQQDTCVEVRWPWLILPGTLAVLTALFLCATIIETSLARPSNASLKDGSAAERGNPAGILPRRRAAVWKESLLPLLFHGLDAKVVEEHNTSGLTPIDELEKWARTLNVRMDNGDQGWKFVKVE